MGAVGLRVREAQAEIDFYGRLLGLQTSIDSARSTVDITTTTGDPLLRLWIDPEARPRPRRSTGLYHFALLVPTRADLGVALLTLIEAGYPLEGAADHLVSEAVYLADPEGNGIEIYRDRPRAEWPRLDGKIEMATDPLDADGLMEEGRTRGTERGLAGGTRMGHVHLNVADLAAAEAFYCGPLGFDLVTRYGDSAGFVSAGGYHHHIGFNTWAGRGAPPPTSDSRGLVYATVLLPSEESLAGVRARLERATMALEERDEGLLVHDPSGNGILLRVGGPLPPP
jgi:catechol 2,3-dioxygenase